MRHPMLHTIALIALAYISVCTMLFLWQERLIFYPERDPPGTRYAFSHPAEEVWIPVDGATLHALWFRVPEPQGVILYLHGNAGSLRSWGTVAPELVAYGYDLLIFDYRGYGQSSGQIQSESQLHADAAAVAAWVLARYPETPLVLYGRSLGSALAVRLAAEHQPRLLILESPFYSLEHLARRQFPWAPSFLLKYPLRAHAWIGQVRSPVVIIHGTDDAIVPFADGERLAGAVTAPLQFHAVAGGGHNDLARFPAYWAAITAALAELQPHQ
jgi:uncharacterized protein